MTTGSEPFLCGELRRVFGVAAVREHPQYQDRPVEGKLVECLVDPPSEFGILGASQDFEDLQPCRGIDILEPDDRRNEVSAFGSTCPSECRQDRPGLRAQILQQPRSDDQWLSVAEPGILQKGMADDGLRIPTSASAS